MADTKTKEQMEAERYSALAKAAQERRRKAPLVKMAAQATIAPKEIIEQYAAEHGGQDAENGYHFAFFPSNEMRRYALKGIEFVRDAGDYVRNDTDVLGRVPTWMHRDLIAANEKQSKRLIQREIDASKNSMVAGEDDETTIRKVGVRRTGTRVIDDDQNEVA